MSKIKIESKNIESINFIKEFEDLDPALGGAMIVEFKRTGAMFAYYPMLEYVYNFHAKKMQGPISANDHFRKNIENLYISKKL
jgi:hypothetical protein